MTHHDLVSGSPVEFVSHADYPNDEYDNGINTVWTFEAEDEFFIKFEIVFFQV